jgi:tryptophan synthase alpha subunit
MTKDLIQSEYDKKHMIELAKKKGADGIIFSDLAMDNERKSTSVIIKAELIKFQ